MRVARYSPNRGSVFSLALAMKSTYLGLGLGLIGLFVLSFGTLRVSDSQRVAASGNSRHQEGLVAQVATEHPPSKAEPANIPNPEFARHIDQLIDQSPYTGARWGMKVVSLGNGATIYSRNAERQFTPASNMKIYTTGVALDLLGADYTWRTSVYAQSQPDASGAIEGDLILYGRGAADLVSQSTNGNEHSLAKLAEDLHARGVRRVKGNVIGDESYFRGNSLGDGWQWNDIQWYFGAEASALTINGNEIDVNLLPPTKADAPPDIRTSDTQGYVQIDNRMAAGNRAVRSTIGLYRGLTDNKVEVWGEFAPGTKGFGARLSVHNPALWAAKIFVASLRAKGITVDGQAQSRNSRVAPSQRFEPTQASELAFVTSRPLSDIARITNKESNNLYAELILRTLGRERRAMLTAEEPPGRERGDDEAGASLMQMWLLRNGVSSRDLAIHDGSGLSRLNLVTPEATTALLVSLSKTGSSHVFRESLPVAGKDGTLAGRLRSVAGRAFAKTGSLTYDNSLSGYLTTSNGETLAFSIFCNDYTGHGSSSSLIDQIVVALASYPDIPPQNDKKSQ
jgi:D-alanyl-D-alanine carboxypeptidase/D-alanyl-D-alanine-endopeptidase (penicillin-binding protein 4)